MREHRFIIRAFKTLILLTLLTLAACSSPPDVTESRDLPQDSAGETAVEPENPPVEEAPPSSSLVVDEVTGSSGEDCNAAAPPPIAAGIAEQFEDTSPTDVMEWYCEGAEFEDILLALQTQKQSGAEIEQLLRQLAEGMSWDEIWLELEIIPES
jgi:hypothetical protein